MKNKNEIILPYTSLQTNHTLRHMNGVNISRHELRNKKIFIPVFIHMDKILYWCLHL